MPGNGSSLFRAGLALFALACMLWSALAQNEASMPVYQLHGSGTSNPAPLIWRAMDIMMARTKPRIALSYRSVGSGTGGLEFQNRDSAFGCGDVPLDKARFKNLTDQNIAVLHVPYLVGSVSIFYNIPGVGEGMRLHPCTLARVLRGAIVAWNDASIIADNPGLPELANVAEPIRVVHRNNGGSSSTYALTHYLHKTCAQQWSKVNPGISATGSGVSDNRQVGVTTEWPREDGIRWFEVDNSQRMVERISGNPYSIGYVESGQGLAAGLDEVAVPNVYGTNLTSRDAVVASPDFLSALFPSNLTSSTWTDVNPVYANISATPLNQWPMTLGTYFYVRQDLAFLNQTGGLLREFLSYMLSDEIAAIMPDYSFFPLPSDYRGGVLAKLKDPNNLKVADSTATGGVAWSVETKTTGSVGQQNYVVSSRRDSYLVSTVTGLATDSAEAKRTLMLGDAYQVHGSGSFVAAGMIRYGMQLLQGRARVPISLTYRAVGSAVAQEEFADYRNMFKYYNHFKVSDMPLNSSLWKTLTSPPAVNDIEAVLQLPFAISALGIYFNKALPNGTLALSCTLLARLYGGGGGGRIPSWSDPDLATFNGFNPSAAAGSAEATLLSAGSTAPVVYGMAEPSGATYALTGYLSEACGGVWTVTAGPESRVNWPEGVVTTYNNASISTPDDMLAAIRGTPGAIGYLPAVLGEPAVAPGGLSEAKLEARGLPTSRVRVGDTDLAKVAVQAADVFSNSTLDLGSVVGSRPYNQDGTWPIPMVQYLFMYRNLSNYGYSGPLLRAFAEFLLDDEAAQMASDSGLTPLPADLRQRLRQQVGSSRLKTLTVVWDSEPAGVSKASVGSGLYTFSANRVSYGMDELAAVRQELAAVKERLAAAMPSVLRLACTPEVSPLTRLLRGDLEGMASSPVRIKDDTMPPAAALAAFNASLSGPAASSASSSSGAFDVPTQMVVYPGPLPSEAWKSLSSKAPIVQVPVSVRPVGLAYRGAAGLRLTPCTLGKILSQTVKWNDERIKADNPGMQDLGSNPVTLLAAGPDDANLRAVLQYVGGVAAAAGCPEYGNLTDKAPAVANITATANIPAALAFGGEYGGLGVGAPTDLMAAAAVAAGLQPVSLPSTVSGTHVTPLQAPSLLDKSACPRSGCAGAVAQLYSDALEELLDPAAAAPGAAAGSGGGAGGLNGGSLRGVPTDATGDWSGFTGQPSRGGAIKKSDVYPVFRLDFLIFPADTSRLGANSGPLARVAAQYGTGPTMSRRTNRALGPFFAGLGPRALQQLVQPSLAVVALLAAGAGKQWSIVDNSTDQAASDDPDSALVLSRAPSTQTAALNGSDAAAAPDLDQQIEWLQRSLEHLRKKVNMTYDIAVAAIVLGIVLSMSSMGLSICSMMKQRRLKAPPPPGPEPDAAGCAPGGLLPPGGCLNVGATKYEAQVDEPPGVNVEMQPAPK